MRYVILLLLTTLLVGCGQIGPLYLPDDSHPAKKHK
ncbi:MAG: lipoprotein [Methylococcales bacterium]|nr:lipoprotein [Methylococcales bacterium]